MTKLTYPSNFLVFILIVLLLVACGGGGGSSSDQSGSEPSEEDHEASLTTNLVSTVQQNIPVDEAMSILSGDNAFLKIRDFATQNSTDYYLDSAVLVEDESDAELITLEFDTDTGNPIVVVRHCRDDDCVYAKVSLSNENLFFWENELGQIPARTMNVPFLRRDIDESDPDSTAIISTIPAELIEQRMGNNTNLNMPLYDFPQNSNILSEKYEAKNGGNGRKLRVASTFGTLWDVNFSSFVSDMSDTDYTDSSATYHVNSNNLNGYFSTLSGKDSLVIYGHGDVSKSKKRAVGMTVSRVWNPYGGVHYNENTMLQQIEANPNGGPGLVFFAGCETAGLLQTFDNNDGRVFLGFSKSIWNGRAAFVIKYFYRLWTEGKTLQETIDAVNALRGMIGNKLEVNASADLSLTIHDIGDSDSGSNTETTSFPALYSGQSSHSTTLSSTRPSQTQGVLTCKQNIGWRVTLKQGGTLNAEVDYYVGGLQPYCGTVSYCIPPTGEIDYTMEYTDQGTYSDGEVSIWLFISPSLDGRYDANKLSASGTDKYSLDSNCRSEEGIDTYSQSHSLTLDAVSSFE